MYLCTSLMKKPRLLIFLFLFLLPLLTSAQRWNRYKYEWTYGIGGANFLGELGGRDRVGTNFIADLELKATRPALFVGFRYKKYRYWAVKVNLHAGMVYGNDNLTKERYRHNRNLNFRSPIVELSTQFEGYYLKEQPGHVYRIRGVKGMKNIDLQAYLFAGVGVFFFNPQGKYAATGKWLNLRPLSTEGQGLAGGPRKYGLVQLCVPMGMGFKKAIDRRWGISLEYGVRKTFTDYIDDVSTVYYDNAALKKEKGPIAAYMADPQLGQIIYPDNIFVTGAGQQRGDDTDNDAYIFAIVSVNYKVYYRRKTRSKF